MNRGRQVVMVSWRDPAHPARGGTETYTLAALRGLVRAGFEVAWLAPWVAGAPREEWMDGIRVLRHGRGPGHLVAAAAHLRRHAHEIDLVIDQVNGYPMFTPLSFGGPRIVLIHQLAREVWFRHLPWPLALVGYLLEPLLLLPYRRHRTVTVSESTRRSLRRLGFRDVVIVPNAVSGPPSAVPPVPRVMPDVPHFVAIGRLVPSKRFEHVIRAFTLVRGRLAGARLTLVGRGRGRYARRLAMLVSDTPGAELLLDADEERKWGALARATALVATSVREGWGLNVAEAHAVGTPSVAYEVAGLRDSTADGVDGLLCAPRPEAAAEAMLRLARDPDLWRRLSDGALDSALRWTPERQGAAFAEVVEGVLRRAEDRRGGRD